jgi:soluble epoxide hydrolase / lipid-phosphate phosphatase
MDCFTLHHPSPAPLLLFLTAPSFIRGGAIVYRIALWYPSLVTHIFAVCTPYTPPTTNWISPEQMVKRLPNFTYQLQLASGDIEKSIKTRDDLRAFLNGLFGGKGPNGEVAFVAEEGVKLDVLKKLNRTKLFTEKVGMTTRYIP